MVKNITPEVRRQLESSGVAVSGDIGGARKQIYYTPDGREVHAVPAMRTYRMSKSGLEGIRDANLDKGWLLQPAVVAKPHCPHCDNWHDNKEEMDACGAKKRAFQKKWDDKARKMKRQDGEANDVENRLETVENGLTEIKDMLKALIKER